MTHWIVLQIFGFMAGVAIWDGIKYVWRNQSKKEKSS